MNIFNNINDLNKSMNNAKLIAKDCGGYTVQISKDGQSYTISRNKLSKLAISLAQNAQELSQFKSLLKDLTCQEQKGRVWRAMTWLKQKIGNLKFKRSKEIASNILKLPNLKETKSHNLSLDSNSSFIKPQPQKTAPPSQQNRSNNCDSSSALDFDSAQMHPSSTKQAARQKKIAFQKLNKEMSEILKQPIENMSVEDFIRLKNLNRQLKESAIAGSEFQKEILELQIAYKKYLTQSIIFVGYKNAINLIKNDEKNELHNERITGFEYKMVDILFKFAKEVELESNKRRAKIIDDKSLRQEMKVRIWRAYQESKACLVQENAGAPLKLSEKHKIKWAHGTKSSTVAMMLHLHRTKALGHPALLPSGELIIKHKAPPLSGELAWGLAGVNKSLLSGVEFKNFVLSMKYATDAFLGLDLESERNLIQQYLSNLKSSPRKNLDFVLRFRLSILRLLRTGQDSQLVKQVKEVITETINTHLNALEIPPINDQSLRFANLIGHQLMAIPKEAQPLVEKPQIGQLVIYVSSDNKTSNVGSIINISNNQYTVRTKRGSSTMNMSIENRVFTLPEEAWNTFMKDPKVKPDLELIQIVKDILENPTQELRHKKSLEEILEDIETVGPYDFSRAERELIDDPAPLVFGTTNPKQMFQVRSDLFDTNAHIGGAEKGIQGEIKLGEDLQFAFTDSKNLERMRAVLAPWGVQVFSFDAGLLISKLATE